MRKIRCNKPTTILVGILFLILFLFTGSVQSAENEFPVDRHAYPLQGSFDGTRSFSHSDYFYDLPSRGFYKSALTPRFSWVNFFAAKMIENRDSFPWSTPAQIKEERFDQVGGMEYELFEGEFRHIDEIRQDLVKDIFPKVAEELLKKTRTGKKLDQLSRKIASYCTVQYLKTEDNGSEFYLPGNQPVGIAHLSDVDGLVGGNGAFESSEDIRDLYGTSLSVRLFNDVNSNPLEYALEVNSFYLTTMTRLRYEPADEKVSFSLTDSRINEIFNCKTAIEFTSEPEETYGVVRLYFNF